MLAQYRLKMAELPTGDDSHNTYVSACMLKTRFLKFCLARRAAKAEGARACVRGSTEMEIVAACTHRTYHCTTRGGMNTTGRARPSPRTVLT